MLTFSCILLNFFSLDVTIFDDVMKFEFILFFEGDQFNLVVYYFIYTVFLYQTITLTFLHFTVMSFNKIVSSYYISFRFYHFYFTSSIHAK